MGEPWAYRKKGQSMRVIPSTTRKEGLRDRMGNLKFPRTGEEKSK